MAPTAESAADSRTVDSTQTAPFGVPAKSADLSANRSFENQADPRVAPASEESEVTPTSKNQEVMPQSEEEEIDAISKTTVKEGQGEAESQESNRNEPSWSSTEVLMPESIPATGVSLKTSSEAERTAVAHASGPIEPLRASIRAENLKGYAPFEIDFEALGNFTAIDWDFGPYGNSTDVNARRTFDRPGTYTVMLTAYGEGGTTITDMVTIEVREGSNLVVPDSFTPNGDGINDTFRAEGVNLASYQLTVTDARGNVVFQTRNIDEPWVFNGMPGSEMEAYFATIRAEGIDGKTFKVRQRINIIY
jgi:hypothetical protein